MRIRLVSIVLGVAAGMSSLVGPSATAVGQGVVLVPTQAYWMAPPRPVAFVSGPMRVCRRVALPAYAGVYLGAQYVYPGSVAPWGSLPAGFYAASLPLAYEVPSPWAQPGVSVVPGTSSYRDPWEGPPQLGAPATEPPRGQVPPSLQPPRTQGPETIPTPPPVEKPPQARTPHKTGNKHRAGGLINPHQSIPAARSPARSADAAG
jgi:hypothetical protein